MGERTELIIEKVVDAVEATQGKRKVVDRVSANPLKSMAAVGGLSAMLVTLVPQAFDWAREKSTADDARIDSSHAAHIETLNNSLATLSITLESCEEDRQKLDRRFVELNNQCSEFNLTRAAPTDISAPTATASPPVMASPPPSITIEVE